MNPDGTPFVVDPKDQVSTSSGVNTFSSEDLEWALAKQKEQHDASFEALVKIRLAALTTDSTIPPSPGGVGSR